MSSADGQKASQLYQQKDWNGLSSLAGRAARADSKDGWAWYYLGLADDGLGKRDEAETAYENSVNLVPQYMRGSVQQLLAQDYAALHQTAKLQALYQQLQKSNPSQASSLQAQFRNVLGVQAAPAAVVPEVSPRTLAAMTASAQRTWRRDAIPVLVSVNNQGNGFKVTYDFYSPSNRTGVQMLQMPGGTTNLPTSNPNWGQAAIPGNFLPLDVAIARAPAAGAPGSFEHAFLYHTGGEGTDPVDLSWVLAMKSDEVRGAAIAAYAMPREQFDRILRAAQNGDPNAQLLAARVYSLGLTGPPDFAQAFHWCAQAAAGKNVEAENVLGQMYEFGRGTAPSYGEAAHWYQIAANSGFAPGEYNLGLMYEYGHGVPQSFINAQQWIAKAAKQGLGDAMGELPYVTARARGEQKQAQAAAQRRPTRCQWSFQWYNPAIGMCVVSEVRLEPPRH